MMNFAHHPGYAAALGMTAAGTLGFPTNFSPHGLHNGENTDRTFSHSRNSFAIQELLGLRSEDEDKTRTTHSDAIISPYLSTSLAPLSSPGLKESPYSTWRSSFINALSSSAQSVFNLTTPQGLSKGETKSGKMPFSIFLSSHLSIYLSNFFHLTILGLISYNFTFLFVCFNFKFLF